MSKVALAGHVNADKVKTERGRFLGSAWDTDTSHTSFGKGVRSLSVDIGAQKEKHKHCVESEGQSSPVHTSHPLALPEITKVRSLAGNPRW